MKGIALITQVPLRAQNSEESEMISQLLFGEQVEIIENQERWLYVRNLTDEQEGWVDKKMIHLLNPKEESELLETEFKCSRSVLSFCKIKNSTATMPIVAGSLIPVQAKKTVFFTNNEFEFEQNNLGTLEAKGETLVRLAKEFLNAPYLWGGKTLLGIDCSGLTQIAYAICGIQLPRNSSQQVKHGTSIDFLAEVKAGDLAFFQNKEGKIIHVGIMLNPEEIIHASGQVKIENIDSEGIISKKTGLHTHSLRIIKRII